MVEIEARLDAIVNHYYEDIVGRYWNERRGLVERCYADLPFPYQEITVPRFEITARWNLPDLLGFLHSWSATQAFERARGYSPLDEVRPDLLAAGGEPETLRTARWPICVRIARLH